ncbi:MAG: 16S rRNA (guanine(966)-N(2))-methyltransferase RsmD [Bacteroidetes bacterium]|nr:16S rRNA (guanine(966)-N(2))-methyltransferase RsmD [Bacteroidota bacterium]
MRIIGGTHKGKQIKTPKDLPVRPTTDFAKEALFNILANKIDFENVSVLDLFSGTGHISLEFASRGSSNSVSVDKNFKCARFLKSVSQELHFNINTIKADVFDFLKTAHLKFDLIFADPPYDMPNIADIHQLVFENNLLNEHGMLIIEHGAKTKLENLPHFSQHRKYGNVNFSFFERS